MSAHMADLTYDVDADSGSVANPTQPRKSAPVANLDLTGDTVVENIGDDDTAAVVTGGTVKKKGGKPSGKGSTVTGPAVARTINPKGWKFVVIER